MRVKENEPPFDLSNATRPVKILGDTVCFVLHHFDLPGPRRGTPKDASRGVVRRRRTTIHVWADSLSMSDVAWVYPTLPRTGSRELEPHHQDNVRDAHVLEYGLGRNPPTRCAHKVAPHRRDDVRRGLSVPP